MFEQVKLGFQPSDLEPHIDSQTVETHYNKHHAAYTKNFNEAVKQAGYENKTVEEILIHHKELDHPALVAALENNGGGYYNHNLYFSTLAGGDVQQPSGELHKQILNTFGDFDSFVEKITAAAMGHFGSGWAWLSADAQGKLRVSTSANQSNPIMETAGAWTPILAVDVWEHAYYLQYKNLRMEYIKALFQVIDWHQVGQLYLAKREGRPVKNQDSEK